MAVSLAAVAGGSHAAGTARQTSGRSPAPASLAVILLFFAPGRSCRDGREGPVGGAVKRPGERAAGRRRQAAVADSMPSPSLGGAPLALQGMESTSSEQRGGWAPKSSGRSPC